MKKLFLILTVAVGLTACKKDLTSLRPIIPSTSTDAKSVDPKFIGNWKIVNLFRNGNDETSDFRDYTFKFDPGGKIYALRSGDIFVGNWTRRTETDQEKFNINFDSAPLTELNNNWNLVERDVNVLKLEFVIRKNVIESLEFRKFEINP